MVICFNCSQGTKRELDQLIESGQYKDYSEAIASAVANLAILQAEVHEKGAVIISQAEQPKSPMVETPASWSQAAPRQRRFSSRKSEVTTSNGEAVEKVDSKPGHMPGAPMIPELFRLGHLDNIRPTIAGLPDDVWAPGQEVPLDRWLFGQYNKLLPAKASCRALANLLRREPRGVALSNAISQISEAAVALGDSLLHHDQGNNIGRDDALSTAFPATNDSADKGRMRYANQFVAGVNSQGQLSGLLIDLKLINYHKRRDPSLQLTDVGWRFATLRNPVLDGLQETPTQKLSAEEAALLLDHIAQSVPAEHFAYRTILAAILDGANTPNTIDTALRKYVPKGRALSESFLASQRSGAISRMSDLGLVSRVRDGVRVLYAVTPVGEQYANHPQSVISNVQ